MKRSLCAAAAVCVFALAVPALAQQPASSGGVDLGGLYGAAKPYLVDIVSTLVTIGTAWLFALVRTKFNLDIDASHRDALQTALTNAAGHVLNDLGNDLKGKTVDVGSPSVANAVNMVVKSAPDALAHFGITPEAVAQKIVAKVPQVANTAAAP